MLCPIASPRLQSLKELMRAVSPKGHAAALASMLLLWFVVGYKNLEGSHAGTVYGFYGAFAMYLIALCVTFSKVSLRLSGPVCLWLGDISYSLYLIHMPVMLALFYLLHRHASLPVLIAISIPASLIAGHIMHILIERPATMLGRRLSAPVSIARRQPADAA